ncbi:actin-1-like [Balearica regulorum gibbericeps]|uniref:actin-1-like n=1 Tax=Balearica regulorum gibbericeps TaxID=100784 RepID=UPI003F5DF0E8
MGTKLAERYKALCTVVINTATGHTRSRLAGDEQPRSVVPSQVEGGPVLTHGMVTDWDGLEELWHCILYRELGVCPEEVAVLATDAPLSPAANREKVAELLFEGFGVPAMLVLPRSLLAAYSYGRTAGVVVGCGAGTSYVAGVREGYVLPHTTCRLDVAGDALTLYLGRLLGSRGVHLGADPLRRLKETCCCVLPGAGGPGPSPRLAPRGCSRGTSGSPQPAPLRGPPPGRPPPRLLLAGGTTLLHGFPRRLAAELGVPVEAAPRRRAAAWLGGLLAASLDAFQGAWVPRDAYDEGGPAAVHPHCC